MGDATYPMQPILDNLNAAFAGLRDCGNEPSGCRPDPECVRSSCCLLLCEEIEASTVLSKAAAAFDDDDDFKVRDVEVTAEPYLAKTGVGSLVRECPRVKASFVVEFEASDDSVSDIYRGLAMRLAHLAERIERRAECEVGR